MKKQSWNDVGGDSVAEKMQTLGITVGQKADVRKLGEIADAIRTVYDGGVLIQPNVAVKVVDRFAQMAKTNKGKDIDNRVNLLTEREIDICRLVGEGKNNKEISDGLFLSEGTIKNHITNILNKLELRDRTQIAIFAIRNDL